MIRLDKGYIGHNKRCNQLIKHLYCSSIYKDYQKLTLNSNNQTYTHICTLVYSLNEPLNDCAIYKSTNLSRMFEYLLECALSFFKDNMYICKNTVVLLAFL